MLLHRPHKRNQLLEGSPWNGHLSYACITPKYICLIRRNRPEQL